MRFVGFITVCLICHLASAQESKPSMPNVVLILADDLGYSDLSAYRNQYPDNLVNSESLTPHIDQLAKQGTAFTNFYAGAAVCSPSRAALLTGKNATRLGIYNWIPSGSPMHLRSEEQTIAEVFQVGGYQTAHFGKWHLTSEGMDQPFPEDQGFDYSFFTFNNAIPSHHNPENFIRNGDPVGVLEGYSCQLVIDEALAWLDKKSDASEPFYMNVWFHEPHEKVAAPDSLLNRHQKHPAYYGAIENMDLAVGRLMDYLDQRKLSENTIVIFTSDNGSQVRNSNEPLRGEKCFNYEGGIRTPFIVRWPGVVAGDVWLDTPGSFVDVLPTLSGLSSVNPEVSDLDGMDLSSVLLGGKLPVESSHRPIFFFRYFHDPVCMLRKGNWVLLGYEAPVPYAKHYDAVAQANLKPDHDKAKWPMWSFQPVHMEYIENLTLTHFELYNIEEDPGQAKDLSDFYPGITSNMKSEMISLKNEMIEEGGDWFE